MTGVDSLPGSCFPLGATIMDGGVNFSVFSKNATAMELILFPTNDNDDPVIVPLNPVTNRTFHYWHIFVRGIGDGQEYGFRANGPYYPAAGLRFDPDKVLLDPYSKAISGWDKYSKAMASAPGSNIGRSLKSVVVELRNYDWEGDRPLRTPLAESVIYEMHVGGFTRHPSANVSPKLQGTFAGIIEKIPYLQGLGITAVELLPVHEFDPADGPAGLTNYWGYNTLGFLAPHHGYSIDNDARAGVNQFRDMVKALHKAGIEVILDVVFNHTGEGDQRGPTLCFRGLDNSIYYLLEKQDRAVYSIYTGCGNSFNANHPVAGRLIIDSLRYWVSEMHVDGFRFDLAAALARDVEGQPSSLPALLWTIESDPVLAGTKLIAEAWDAAGLYRVGWFVNISNWYAEWNGPFRDDLRRFVKGEANTVSSLASRVTGSPDIYTKSDREPNRSINFITCHDGFTLRDLVSYNSKHNEANGENNRDGSDNNFSWNCGAEGATEDAGIEALRNQQSKNLLTILLISQGTPMILMGDEVGRTQEGNNNAYCQNNALSWFNWNNVAENSDLYRFTRELIAFTQSLDIFKQTRSLGSWQENGRSRIIWHGVKLHQPDWTADSHSLSFTLDNPLQEERLHVILNAYWEPLEFELPDPGSRKVWKRVIDTSLPSPLDIAVGAELSETNRTSYTAGARSTVVLMAMDAAVIQ